MALTVSAVLWNKHSISEQRHSGQTVGPTYTETHGKPDWSVGSSPFPVNSQKTLTAPRKQGRMQNIFARLNWDSAQKFASYGLSFIAVILPVILGEQLQNSRMCDLNKQRGLSKCFELEPERTEQCSSLGIWRELAYSRELFPARLNSILSHWAHCFLRIKNTWSKQK